MHTIIPVSVTPLLLVSLSPRLLVCVILLCVSVSLRLILPETAAAQVRPVYDQGALGLLQQLRKLNTSASALMIGAHPDDEDTALLAYLARGENARTAYLSLTRGDGGQNILGPELGEALGVIRTEESLQARRLDGAEQFFTRAYDYGFSKTLEEAKEKWDEKTILCDMVRVIRSFRPLVVISQFTGTASDGHGHHQYAGYITPLAIKAAADSGQCGSSGPPWQVQKFYIRHGFRATSQPSLRVNTGKYDSLLGRSYFEIAMEARSQHKSQEQGVLELKGDQFSGLNLVESRVPRIEKEQSVFDGIDTSIKRLLPDVSVSVERALREFDPSNPGKIVPVLTQGYRDSLLSLIRLGASPILRDDGMPNGPPDSEDPKNAKEAFTISTMKRKELSEAIRGAAGIRIDALSDKETIAAGETFQVAVKAFFPQGQDIKIEGIRLTGLHAVEISDTEGQAQTSFRREIPAYAAYFRVSTANVSRPTQPYWLVKPRNADLYPWTEAHTQGEPFQEPVVSATVIMRVAGEQIHFIQPVQYRYADGVRGEVRRDVNIVPKLSIALNQSLVVVPKTTKSTTRKVVVTVTNNTSRPLNGQVRLNLPAGWPASPSKAIELKRKSETATTEFAIDVPTNASVGTHVIGAEVQSGDESFSSTMNTIEYPHIQTHRLYSDAKAVVKVFDLQVAPVKIGYIEGSGDRVPEAVKQFSQDMTMLGENDLAGDLSKFDVVMVGIRASEVRPDFVANNQRLLDYVTQGGTLIVQYQRQEYLQRNMMPFPAQIGPRVANENAPVKILQPEHPVFNFPNKITAADFDGWVQERNLYSFSTFDERYLPLLESHDPGEPENKGGLVIANIGKGKYVYISYALFRQLPAGVPGAFRLLANLLSLPKAPTKP